MSCRIAALLIAAMIGADDFVGDESADQNDVGLLARAGVGVDRPIPPGVVKALEEEGHPADLPLAQRHPQITKAFEDSRGEPICEGV